MDVGRSFCCLLLLPLLLPACAATPIPPGTPMPEGFSLALQRKTTDGRSTYFELSRAGELAYGGGRDAVVQHATPVLTLTPAQRQQLWDLVVEHRLLDTPSAAFTAPRQVAYDVSIHAGRFGSRRFRCVDDAAPGLAALHDALFQLQADVRYKVPGIR